ncbi:MAG TPA: YetF domain-containing protein [Oscillospiraceae bacterium]|nr:YetF domain-containing protein [Oscillospiraceae bacterium]
MDFHNEYVQIIISTVAVYLFIIVAIRLFGKKELSQLSVVDLVFILLISNSVQNAMVGSNSTLAGGLVAAAALFIVNFLFKEVLYHFPKFGRLVQGETLMLIYKGKLIRKNVDKAKLTTDEIMEAIREHGVSKIEEVDLAVLEVDGNISVLSNEFSHMTVNKMKPRKKSSKNQVE